MAYTSAQLSALETAIANGVLRVESPTGQIVVYQNLTEMRTALAEMRAELGIAAPTTARGKAWKPITGTGL